MKLILIRHGESLSDVHQQYNGDYDDPLTQHGRDQAREIAQHPLLHDIECIYTSPKIRARETASILQDHHRVPIEIVEDMAEQDIYGAFLDLAKDQPEEEYRRLGEVLVNKDTAYDGAETYHDFRTRVLESLEALQTKPHSKIALITHGGPIRCILREYFPNLEVLSLGNGAMVEIELQGEEVLLGEMINITLR